MEAEVNEMVKDCEESLLTQHSSPNETSQNSGSRVAIDFYEAPSIGAKVISLVDYLTRKLIIHPCKSGCASFVINELEMIFKRNAKRIFKYYIYVPTTEARSNLKNSQIGCT